MKKKKRTALFILFIKAFVFPILFSFSTAGIYGFIEAGASGSAESFQLSQSVRENETPTGRKDQQLLSSILNAEVKYIEFSDSPKYTSERNIVHKNTNMAESEKYSEGSMKRAVIRIALEDLNDDGIKEILAYIIQFEYCGKGGGYCTFLILQRDGAGSWRELFKISAYPDLGISNAKNLGFHELFFRNIVFRIVNREKVKDKEEIVIWRWDGKRYMPFVRREAVYDPKTKMEKKTVMKWDVKSSSWVE